MNIDLLTKEDLELFKNDLFAKIENLLLRRAEPPKKWLRSSELKQIFDLSPGTLQTLRINNTLKFSKIGGIIFYDYDHIEKVLEMNYQNDEEYQGRKKRQMKEVLGKRK